MKSSAWGRGCPVFLPSTEGFAGPAPVCPRVATRVLERTAWTKPHHEGEGAALKRQPHRALHSQRTFASARSRSYELFGPLSHIFVPPLRVRCCRPPQDSEKPPLVALQHRVSCALCHIPSDLGARPDELWSRLAEIFARYPAHCFAVIREMSGRHRVRRPLRLCRLFEHYDVSHREPSHRLP